MKNWRKGLLLGCLLSAMGTISLAAQMVVADSASVGLETGNIHDHHHVEIFLQDRLRDVKNVHVVVSQIITRFCNDTDAVLSNDSNNNLTHRFHPPVCSPSYGGNVFMTY